MLKQVQTMSSVPRTLGTDVNFVFSGGREQVGVNENGMARGMHFAGTVVHDGTLHEGRTEKGGERAVFSYSSTLSLRTG